ncbi:nucleoside triphosphate pyrophosphatase [Novosphingobium sp.]|uniref:Maf family protein n=1 Tax=Novosphingobium sp. TaxID=1874826 RepID=UPI0027341629|nr:Maf family protein [Novosphingobium sp.]MDP3906271.1 Maf family protein [Novosphingobium sp.]
MLVLASQSASRQAMLTAAGVAFTPCPADVDERALEASMAGADPDGIALALARAKALAVSAQHVGALVLGSDSLVEVAGRRFDKPRSRAEAAEHLRFFSGQAMRLHSAVALAQGGAVTWQHGECAVLQVRPLTEGFIERYLAAEWPDVRACVGVFRIEGLGVNLFETITGSHFTVLGMPLLAVLGALREAGELPA